MQHTPRFEPPKSLPDQHLCAAANASPLFLPTCRTSALRRVWLAHRCKNVLEECFLATHRFVFASVSSLLYLAEGTLLC